jgi:hypothetical protein
VIRRIVAATAFAGAASVAFAGAAGADGFGNPDTPPPGPRTYFMNEGGPVPAGCCKPGDQLNVFMYGPTAIDRCFARGGFVRFMFGRESVTCYAVDF